MVISELGSSLAEAMKKMINSVVPDQTVVNELIKEICNSLLRADVNLRYVLHLQANLSNKIKLDQYPSGFNKRTLIQSAIKEELEKLLESNKKEIKIKRGEGKVIMMIGLQGNGKTTTVAKLGNYYKKRGYKIGVVCADTFRAAAFDQLQQNCARCRLHFFGIKDEKDPVKVAKEGVDYFKNSGFDLIIVDTSGRSKQDDELFLEMSQITNAIGAEEKILVMDGSIGQAAYDHALAFKNEIDVTSVIITKLDHNKGGAALSAVAATKSGVIFIGTGEHMEDFEEFNCSRFVDKLLGIIDIKKDIGKAVELMKNQKNTKIDYGNQEFSFKILRDQYNQMIEMPSQILKQFTANFSLGKGDLMSTFKIGIIIMDSFTTEELENSEEVFFNKNRKNELNRRITRICRGSGKSQADVETLLHHYLSFKKIMKKSNMLDKSGKISSSSFSAKSNLMKNISPSLLKQFNNLF